MNEVRVTPTWFGSQQPLFGWVHEPSSGPARGGVVICPTLAKEYMSSHRAIRGLADALARAGLVALRFDYPWTGDSADGGSDDHVADWLAGIRCATALLRDAGLSEVALVGLRIGATLAAEALPQCGPTTTRLVLWDPFGTGREFVREQMALHRLSVGQAEGPTEGSRPDEDAVDGSGVVFSGATVRGLRSLTLDRAAQFAADHADDDPRVLLLVRPDRVPRSVRALVDAPGVRTHQVPGQPELLDVPSYDSSIPVATLDLIVEYLRDTAMQPETQFTWSPRDTAVVATSPRGDVVEHLSSSPPNGMFTITTTTRGARGRWVVFMNVATDHHVGPGRLWVDVARQAAAQGVRSVRFDRREVGDSAAIGGPGAAGISVPMTYTAASADDVADLLASLPGTVAGAPGVETNGRPVLVGLCSGAWAAAVAGVGARAHTVVLVNPLIWLARPKPIGSAGLRASDAPTGLTAQRTDWRALVKRRTPYSLWRQLGRAGLVNVPETLLRPLLRRGTRVHVMLGETEKPLFTSQRGPESVKRLAALGGDLLSIHDVPQADHSLQRSDGRAAIAGLLLTMMADAAGAESVG